MVLCRYTIIWRLTCRGLWFQGHLCYPSASFRSPIVLLFLLLFAIPSIFHHTWSADPSPDTEQEACCNDIEYTHLHWYIQYRLSISKWVSTPATCRPLAH
ncbi:hypothetical protein BDW59DRAFT_91323 [Aspergillus cavernicola]|uniref:Uncharacterized protein n=1 Tax=Aspergillus cavernicola TaxID=176166 RepID=A0ABR4I864_9EURO